MEVRKEAGTGGPPSVPEKVVFMKPAKFRNVGKMMSRIVGSGSMMSHVNERRCVSMGSFEDIMDDSSLPQVPIKQPAKKTTSRQPSLPLTPDHRPAMLVYDSHSSKGFNGFSSTSSGHGVSGKRESFSVSKIWLQSQGRERAAIGEISRHVI